MMNEENRSEKERLEWTKCIYAQAWEQYVHEDNLMEERNKTYLTVATILLSLLEILTAVVGILIEKNDIQGIGIYLIIILGGIFSVLMIFSHILETWEQVTRAGDQYVNLRFNVIKKIEYKYAVKEGLAKEENYWRKYKRKSDWVGGFQATLNLITEFRKMLYILGVLDIIGILILLIS